MTPIGKGQQRPSSSVRILCTRAMRSRTRVICRARTRIRNYTFAPESPTRTAGVYSYVCTVSCLKMSESSFERGNTTTVYEESEVEYFIDVVEQGNRFGLFGKDGAFKALSNFKVDIDCEVKADQKLSGFTCIVTLFDGTRLG